MSAITVSQSTCALMMGSDIKLIDLHIQTVSG